VLGDTTVNGNPLDFNVGSVTPNGFTAYTWNSPPTNTDGAFNFIAYAVA